MLSGTPVTVDRGRYQDTVTPWEEPAWRTEAIGWTESRLAAHGLRPTGAWRARLRPWSVLLRVDVVEAAAVRVPRDRTADGRRRCGTPPAANPGPSRSGPS
ncbi:hypothetical protein STENM327S_01459 [Streptomyces tendae]